MDSTMVSSIRNNFNNLPSSIEENVKIHVVIETLDMLGYSKVMLDFEHPIYHNKGRVDIAINIHDKNWLYVEVKRGDYDLTDDDIIQLANYINTKGIEWGILTNGKNYILFNNNIEIEKSDSLALFNKIVFSIDVFNDKDIEYLKYFSREAIFESKVTYYFKDIAQFKAYKFPNGGKSWNVYRGTLFNFFVYYSKKENKYRSLNEIRIDDFTDYLHIDQENKKHLSRSVNSVETFKNKCSHFNSMLEEFENRGKIGGHNFKETREGIISGLNYEKLNKKQNYLNEANINQIMEHLKQTRNSTRNMCIFMFSIYMGLERSTLINLNWKMINLSRGIININNREIPLPKKLLDILKELKKENKENGIKGKYLFYRFYGNRYEKITEDTVHNIFDNLSKIDGEIDKWSMFSPQYIRNNLVISLFDSGFHLEEIIYLTGIDLLGISKLLTYEEICNKVASGQKSFIKKHPFYEILK